MKSIPFSQWLKAKRISADANIMGSEHRIIRDAWHRWEDEGNLPYPKSVPKIAEILGVRPIEVACAIVGISQSALLLQPQSIFLRVMRLSRGFTLRDIESRGIPISTWCSWEKNKRVPEDSPTNIQKITKILGVSEPTLIRVLYHERSGKPTTPRCRVPLKGGRIFVRQC